VGTMILSITTLRIEGLFTTLSKELGVGAMTLSKMTLGIMTLRIEGLFTTLNVHDTQQRVGTMTLSKMTLGIMTLRI
jgi:hypothetical protein